MARQTDRELALAEQEVGQQVRGVETQFAGTDGGMKQAKEGVAEAHHSQTRSRIPEGWGTAPAPFLPPPATRAVLPP